MVWFWRGRWFCHKECWTFPKLKTTEVQSKLCTVMYIMNLPASGELSSANLCEQFRLGSKCLAWSGSKLAETWYFWKILLRFFKKKNLWTSDWTNSQMYRRLWRDAAIHVRQCPAEGTPIQNSDQPVHYISMINFQWALHGFPRFQRLDAGFWWIWAFSQFPVLAYTKGLKLFTP